MTAIAKVFTTGNSQALRLPKAYRVNAREMWISRNEHTGEITLRPKPDADALQAFLNELQSLPASDEFVPPRDDAARADPQAAYRYGTPKDAHRRAGTPIGELDTQIAAHALAEGLVLVTHNTRHFKQVPGLTLEHWMAEPPARAAPKRERS